MPFRLNDGTNFRIVDNNNKDISTNAKIDPNNAKIQIDIDKDGKYDGKNDITITDKNQISLLTDNIKGNVPALDNINFVDQIEGHIINNKTIEPLLDKAKKYGEIANKTSIFNMDKKVENGKVAFESTQKAFRTDKANPAAKQAYGMSVLKIYQSSFTSTAESKLGINLKECEKEVTKELEKDKFDITGQMILRGIYEKTDNPAKTSITQNLASLKEKFPDQYKESEKIFKELSKD